MAGDIDPPALDLTGESIEESADNRSAPVESAESQGWKLDKRQRYYTSAGPAGRAGVIYRDGDESIQEAIDRDREARENGRPPKSKPAKTTKAPAPTRKTAQELEKALTASLEAPAMLAGLHGDEWVASHIYREAPTLARNLVAAAEHNPKLWAKLESIAGGETAFGQMILQIAVANALVAYALPPMLFYLGDRAPQRLRDTFQVPPKPRKQARQESPGSVIDEDALARWAAEEERPDAGPQSTETGSDTGV
jgi:hypothetical protein